jgi:hypothetical protein
MGYKEVGLKGGLSQSRLYNTWLHMKGRCYRKTDEHFKYYGARGIKMCDQWKEDFNSFREWSLSNGYKAGLTIDRINNNGDYEPSNCRWVSMKDQCNNRRSNILVTINGVTHNIQEWSEISGVKYHTVYRRFKCGWTGIELLKGGVLVLGRRKGF